MISAVNVIYFYIESDAFNTRPSYSYTCFRNSTSVLLLFYVCVYAFCFVRNHQQYLKFMVLFYNFIHRNCNMPLISVRTNEELHVYGPIQLLYP